MWDAVLDAVIDSLKVLAVLIIVYFAIGLVEGKISKAFNSHKKWMPFAAVSLAILPQCGVSVVATDLYQKHRLSLGALIGVYIATSDEALPILLATPEKAIMVLPLIGVKLLVGMLALVVIDLVYRPKKEVMFTPPTQTIPEEEIAEPHSGCCGHKIESTKEEKLRQFVLHPLLHSLKIFVYILVVNILFGIAVFYIGEENLIAFMDTNKYIAPLFAVIIGLIPNCVSSVVITNMYLVGGLGFGACVGGLCAGAGLGLMMLFKKQKDFTKNLVILALLIVISLATGYAVSAVTWLA